MTTIPASELVNVSPSVQGAGGSAVDVIGLVLTTSTRPPIGSVLSFPNGAAVSNYFGASSKEAQIANGGAGLGSGYFGGFVNSNKLPSNILFAQYNTANVAAYLRGGNISAISLATLQSYSGTLNVTIDGVLKTSSVNLSAATSFTNAAEIIANDLGIFGVAAGTVTGSIGGTATTSTTSGTTLTLGALASGEFQVGDTLTATDGTHTLSTQTIVAQLSGAPGGGAGATFQMSAAGTGGDLTSCTVTAKGKTLTVSALGTAPTITAGDTIAGSGVTAGTYVVGQITPLISGEVTGGAGRYTINATQAGVVASETLTLDTPAVQFDSVSGAFVIYSGTTGSSSTITFGSGAMASSLLLTSATGAVLSQGAVAAVPATFMNALIVVNQNWVTFGTAFDPDNGSGNTVKQAFAAWKNTQNNRFAYICWDTDITPTTTLPATGSLGYILANNNDSGTALIYEPTDLNLMPFIMGAAASIDFTQRNGRISFAYKMQAGLVASVSDPTIAANLGGNPQASDRGNGYNFYGAYGNANQNFVWFQRGFVTGPYLWLDSYIGQVWFNSLCQSALLNLQKNSLSIPYSVAGNTLMDSALADPIQAGLNFGLFGPGVLSNAQIAAVNAAAGTNIATSLQTQGYYLQILPASPTSRAARTTPPAKLWYIDVGSVQAINLASVALL